MDLRSFDAVLLDLDGTIYHEDHVLPGAAELVRLLAARGQKYACLSNSTLSPNGITRRLTHMGIDVPADNIYSAAAAGADYVLGRYRPPRCIFNLSSEGVHELLNTQVQWVQAKVEHCDAVVVGSPVNRYASDDRRLIALALLRNGAELVGLCADRVYPSPRGLEFGVGSLCAMLGYAADVRPTFCGKPQEHFFRKLCGKLNVEPSGCVLIGDNPESDIVGAKPLGVKTILTLTGVMTREDVAKLPPTSAPDAVVMDLTQLLQAI